MAVEALAWPLPPADTDENDGTQAYNMGVEFSLVAATPLPGIEWRVPDTLATPPGGTHTVAIWNKDTATRLAYKEIVPTPGATERYLFDTPVSGLTGVNYFAVVYTNHYVFRVSNPAGVTSPSGNIVAGPGGIAPWNGGGASAPMPNDGSTLTFYISPLGGEDDESGNVDATGDLALPVLTATGELVVDNPAAGSLLLPALTLTGELGSPGELAGDVALPALTLTGSLDLAAVLAGDLLLPELDLLGELAAGVTAAGALTLPALDLLGTALVEGEPVDPGDSAIPTAYRELVAGLKVALRPAGLRVRDDVSDTVGRGDVVIGPPSFQWDGLCDPDEPDSITFELYLIERVGERAIDNLLAKLPALIRAVQAYRDATITGPVVPGSFPAGASDLPCYQLTVEMTL